jgi:hypothetical protein
MNPQVFLIGAFIGILATLVMDLSSIIGLRLGFAGKGPRRTGFHLIGRWFLYLLRGKGSHSSILDSPSLDNEVLVGSVVHYCIGGFLGAVYLVILQTLGALPTLVSAVGFGIATTVFPWFYLYPSWGYGWLGGNANGFRMTYFSLYNHTFFGLGIALWASLLSPQ